MAKSVIPNDLYVGFQMRSVSSNQASADGGKHVALGFVTYRNQKGVLQHKDSFDKWRDQSIPRIPFDNLPTKELSIQGYATRYSTSNKLIRIEDPRNFQVEISIENAVDVLRQVTMVNGVIQDEMVWGWQGGIKLYKAGTDECLEAQANFKYDGMPNIPTKELKLGDEILLHNGKSGIYYGAYHTVVPDHWLFNKERVKNDMEICDSKRKHFVKINDKYESFAALKVKHVESRETLNKDDVLKEFKNYIEFNIKSETNYDAFRDYCRRNNIQEIKYYGDPNTSKTMLKFGLSDKGYRSLIDNGGPNQDDFRNLYMIKDKVFKHAEFKEYYFDRIKHYEQMLTV